MNVEERLKKLFAKVIKDKEVLPTHQLKDLGMDSLDLVEFLMEIEEEFGIEFSNDEMVALKTVGDVYTVIESKIQK